MNHSIFLNYLRVRELKVILKHTKNHNNTIQNWTNWVIKKSKNHKIVPKKAVNRAEGTKLEWYGLFTNTKLFLEFVPYLISLWEMSTGDMKRLTNTL